jgi:threonine synthase
MERISFYSTNLKAPKAGFREALLKGLASDRGLFMPEAIPILSPEEIKQFSSMEYHEIAFDVMRRFLHGEIDEQVLADLCKDAYNFEIPLEPVVDNKFIMRLDQGPTASFKDFAARMMGRLMSHYLKEDNRKLLILTATSGDTGSAIANAFYGLDRIEVLVLYPEGEVTQRQRKQMTTLGKNVKIIELKGKFDDCQALVKQAFSDPELDFLGLSSANSINIGRLIPQIVYYFYAFSRLRKGMEDDQIIFSVPSGNFGDMMGGVLGMKMGLPVKKFIISTNENDEFPNFLSSGEYQKIEPSKNCISSAMNVGHPSNLARLVALYGGVMDEKGHIAVQPDMGKMRKEIYASAVSDGETMATIIEAWEKYQLLLEPHGSVGWKGLMKYLSEHPEDKDSLCVSLETAHPAKFPEEIQRLLEIDPALPASLQGLENLPEACDHLNNHYESFKAYLLNQY